MQFQVKDRLDFPAREAFLAYRDEMSDLAAYLKDVKSVEVVKREDQPDGSVKLHNLWSGDTSIPAILKPVISPKMLCWDDYAVWYEDKLYCDWYLKTAFLREYINVNGRTSFVDGDGGCAMSLDINLTIGNIPGIPGFMQAKATGAGEKLLSALLMPNLRGINKSLNKYLTDKHKK